MKKILLLIILLPSFIFADVQPIISDEVGFSNASSRYAVDILSQEWRNLVESQGACSTSTFDLSTALVLPANTANYSDLGVDVDISSRDMDGTSVIGVAGGTINLDNSTTLQDGSPRPSTLFTGNPLFFNEASGSAANRNAALVSFDTPVRAFGAWFGDMETRSSLGDTPAILRFFDFALNQIGSDALIEPSELWLENEGILQTDCGGTVRGCGNRTTRWVGFYADPSTPVSHMLVLVGDHSAGGDGFLQRVSMIGPTLATDFSCSNVDLEIQKFEGANNVALSQNINYSISLINHGPAAATNVVVTDTLPAGLSFVSAVSSDGSVCSESLGVITCTVPSMAKGDSLIITIVASPTVVGSYTNMVTVTSDGTDTDNSTDMASVTTEVVEFINCPLSSPIVCEVANLENVSFSVDGSALQLRDLSNQASKTLGSLIRRGLCPVNARSGVNSLVQESESSYLQLWNSIWSIPARDFVCTGDVGSSCSSVDTRAIKSSVLALSERMSEIVIDILNPSCANGVKRVKNIRKRSRTLLSSINTEVSSISDDVTQCSF